MIRGFYTARTGLVAHQERIDVISNNMANVNTVAYKAMRPSFQDLIYQNVNREQAENTAMTGHGVKVNQVDTFMQQGQFQITEREYDLALELEGDFFMVENPNGDVLYTRAGNFYAGSEDDTFYLVTASGQYVLDIDGERMELPVENGSVVFDPIEVGVFRFPNPYALRQVGGNCYAATDTSGEPEEVEDPAVKTGYLEGSNVYMAQEMVSVIEASKAFSFNARMVSVADEIEQTVNSLR